MAIIPTVRCRDLKAALKFYTGVLDFTRTGDVEVDGDSSFAVLARAGDLLFLSSNAGDAEFGHAVVVMTEDLDALFQKFRSRDWCRPRGAARFIMDP
jgi:catechol 2,3-dioxygenase-like lactoylglutathione lyase family enzyme